MLVVPAEKKANRYKYNGTQDCKFNYITKT